MSFFYFEEQAIQNHQNSLPLSILFFNFFVKALFISSFVGITETIFHAKCFFGNNLIQESIRERENYLKSDFDCSTLK